MKRSLTLSGALVTLLITVGCSAQAEETPAAAPSTTSATESATPSVDPSASSSTDDVASAGSAPTVLLATVGTPEDPDAYEIALTDQAGQPVTSVPAGDYQIQVSDPSDIHNFHLIGGAVDETTTVAEVVETTFAVTLDTGDYTYLCDPHPAMVGELIVT